MRRTTLLALLCSASVGALAAPAFAAVGDSGDVQPAGAASTVQEVVVTAEKRPQRVQDVPASITVLSNSALQDLHAGGLDDFAGYVPGLEVQNNGSAGSAELSLDGVAPITGSSVVKIYFDDTAIGSSTGNTGADGFTPDLLPYDLDHIEVLRGPQSTLYGADTMGGLIKYVLKSPNLSQYSGQVGADLFGIQGGGGVGDQIRASVNVPIVNDTLALRASYYTQYTPGYMDDVTTGWKDDNGARVQGGRVALLWSPISDFSIEATALLQDRVQSNPGTVTYNPVTLQPFPGGGTLSNNYYLAQPFTENIQLYDVTMKWDLQWAKLTATSSYQTFDAKEVVDITALEGILGAIFFGAPFISESAAGDVSKYTEEVRLASPTSSVFEWMVGGYYTYEKGMEPEIENAYTAPGATIAADPIVTAALDSTYQEYAAFGNATWHVTDRLDLTGGVRYAVNNQTYLSTIAGPLYTKLGIPPLPPATGKSNQGVATWMVSPNYHVDKNTLVYVRVATGYQAGGPNGTLPGVTGLPPTFNPSTLIDYQVGFKSVFLDNRASVDASAYYIDWSDIQVPINVPGVGSTTGNGGRASAKGFDLSTTYSPLPHLVLGGNLSYADSALTNAVPTLGTAAGARLPFIPLWSGSLTANYTTPIEGAWSFLAGGGVHFTGSSYSDVEGQTVGTRPAGGVDKAFTMVDLHAGVTDGSWKITIYAKNLTDNLHLSDIVPVPGAFEAATIAQPRTIGVSIDKSF